VRIKKLSKSCLFSVARVILPFKTGLASFFHDNSGRAAALNSCNCFTCLYDSL